MLYAWGIQQRTVINLLRLWEGNKDNNSEHFWQVQFRDHRFAFSQLFSVPVTFLAGQAFVGGMGVEHRDAKFVDFLLGGGSSKDAILVEIKVPGARPLGSKYRSVYRPSRELIGSLMQINDYRSSLTREFEVIARNSQHRFAILNPKCIVIAGNFKQELGSELKQRSFELIPSSLSGIEIITYDELFDKLDYLLQVFGLMKR